MIKIPARIAGISFYARVSRNLRVDQLLALKDVSRDFIGVDSEGGRCPMTEVL
jgi:hypothetical protein